MSGTRRGPWLAARLAAIAFVVLAIIGLLRAILAMGFYEHRIDVVAHGHTDPVLPALMAYEFLDHVLPRGMASTVGDRSWILATMVAAAAFTTWLHRARRDAGRLGGIPAWAPWWASVLATVLLHGLAWLYGVATSDGGMFEKTALDMRVVAYPLWTAEAVMIAVTAFLTVRVMRRGTEAQHVMPGTSRGGHVAP